MDTHTEDFSQIDISKEEKDKLVAEMVRYILFKTQQTGGCPIKREELTQLVTRNYRQRNLPAYILKESTKTLALSFGYELRELQRARPSSGRQPHPGSQQSAGDQKSYILVSKLPSEAYKKFVENKENAPTSGFTFTVVGVVHLAGGAISEENLWHHLKRMGLNENDESHPVFGNVKHALENLVLQRYLQKEKVSGPEGHTMMYELAERALDASFNRVMKEHITKIASKDAAPQEAVLE